MEKGIITVVGEDQVGIIAESLYIFSRKQVKYLRYFANNYSRIL